MARMNYKAAVKVLIEHGDFTTFSQVITVAFPTYLAKAVGMNTSDFHARIHAGMKFTPVHIKKLAAHLEITQKKLKELMKNDPLYKEKKAKKSVK